MKAINYSDARQNLASLMDSVCQDHGSVIITRQKAASVVMLSLEDYEAMQETGYLLRSPANAKRLAQALEQAESGALISPEPLE